MSIQTQFAIRKIRQQIAANMDNNFQTINEVLEHRLHQQLDTLKKRAVREQRAKPKRDSIGDMLLTAYN